MLLICWALLLTQANAQHVNRDLFIKDSLDIYMSRALTNWRIPGAAVCIVKDDKIVLMKGYGIKELGLADKVTDKTVFMIGDNTAPFTATAMLMLEAGKKVSLDDKVTRYLPDFNLDDKVASQQVTLRDLLTHRLGFEPNQGDFTFYNTNLSALQIIEKMKLMKAPYPFRSKWGYSDADYTVLSETIPYISGKTWDAYLTDNVFTALGMTNTIPNTKSLKYVINKAVPHTYVDGRLTAIPYARLEGTAAANGICTTVNDMGKWVLALLADGKVNNKSVIPATVISAMQQQQITVGKVKRLNGETGEQQYGLGWFLESYAGHKLVMSNGRVNGYTSSVTLVPEEHLGIIVLTNTDQSQLPGALCWEILDAFFKLPYRNYSNQYLKAFKAQMDKKQQVDSYLLDSVALNLQPGLPAANYTGKYNNELYGIMTVTRGENNDLEMRFEHHPTMFVRLQPLGGNRFFATFSDPLYGKAVFSFTFKSGAITAVTVKVDDKVERGAYEFRKMD